mgnify:FL=1
MKRRLSLRTLLVVVLVMALSVVVHAQVVIRHMGNWDAFDPNSDIVAEAIEKVTGYKVEYSMLPVENMNEVLSLRVSNVGAYDSLKLNSQQYNMLTAQKALLPLDDLLEKYGQRILEVIKEETWEAAKVDGKIYGVPEVPPAPNVNHVILARKDILDELNLAVPETVDEFYDVLKTIRKEKNMLPLAMAQHNFALSVVTSGFGIYHAWMEVDGAITHQVEHPKMKEYVEFMAKLYEENLIDQDFPVNATQHVVEKFTSGRAAMIPFAWWQAPAVLAALEQNVPGSEWVVIPPLKDESGNRGIEVDGGILWFVGIPQGAKNVEDVVKWWNAKLELDNHKYIALGDEGVHYYEENGAYFPILPVFEDERNMANWSLTGVDQELYPTYWASRVRKNAHMSKVYDAMQELRQWGSVNPVAWAPALPTVSKYTQSLNLLTQDNLVNFIAGGDDVRNYGDFVDAWRASGGQESTVEVNNWYQSR